LAQNYNLHHALALYTQNWLVHVMLDKNLLFLMNSIMQYTQDIMDVTDDESLFFLSEYDSDLNNNSWIRKFGTSDSNTRPKIRHWLRDLFCDTLVVYL